MIINQSFLNEVKDRVGRGQRRGHTTVLAVEKQIWKMTASDRDQPAQCVRERVAVSTEKPI